QAEDGIRDFHVTGVQTCALPISRPDPGHSVRLHGLARAIHHRTRDDRHPLRAVAVAPSAPHHWRLDVSHSQVSKALTEFMMIKEIGRASCRERVVMMGRAGGVKK